jgi:CzcA family heavy metal efflux pump
MIARIIDFSLHNRLVVLFGAALLIVLGAWQTSRMPVDIFPDLTAPTVTVVAEAHGMSPTEVESQVTFPLETALNGAAGVRRVRSFSAVGLAVVTIEFEWSMELMRARQVVAERLQIARASLPADLPSPLMTPAASIMGEIMFIALTSDRADGMQLKSVADWGVRRRILAVPGVAEVITIGGDEKQYQVTLQPERLAAYNVTLSDVLRAVRESNENTSAGFFIEGSQEHIIQAVGRVQRAEDIGEAVVAMHNGQPVLVKYLGTIGVGPGIVRGTGSHNGKPAVIFAIQKQPGANTLDLTRRLDRAFETISSELPEGMKIEARIFRQADFIERAIDNLLSALRDGAILIVVIVFLFLFSTRATLVTLVALPLSLLAAVLVLKHFEASLNTMTLGGLAIALGALVDDAIIVVENILRRLKQHFQTPEAERKPTIRVVLDATTEIQGSIVFATLIIILVFLPMFSLAGVEGRLLAPLGVAYIVALAASLLVAITATPALAYVCFRESYVEQKREPRWLGHLKARYMRTLDVLIGRWRLIALLALVAFGIAVAGIVGAGRAFLPDFNEGSLTVNLTTVPGTSLEQSDRLGLRVEQVLLSHPEIAATARRTGRAPADPHAQEIYASEIEATLDMKHRSKEELLKALRSDLSAVSGVNVVLGQPISHRIDHMLSGTRANIAVKIFGPDLYELRRIGERVKAETQAVQGAVDVALEQQADIPMVLVRLRRDAIARYGLTVGDVAEAVEAAFAGTSVSRVLEGEARFDLVVRFDPAVRDSLDAMRSIVLTTNAGAQVPLSALADVRKDRGPNLIGRESVQRRIVVMANVAGRDLQGVVDDISARVKQNVKLPPGYVIEYGGQFESATEATRTLLLLSMAVVAGILALLFIAFRSTRDAVLVMVNLPLALIGGVAGMYIAGGVLSIATLIGFITLFGIATRNGVMLVAHIRRLRDVEGVSDPRKAVIIGATERLVPILMTALAAGLGLVPLALALGHPGSEIQAPMAMVILCGLFSSTLLNMFVVPSLYLRFGGAAKESS